MINGGKPTASEVSGVSLFAVDPGETIGWAWCCVGVSELRTHGVVQSLARARSSGRSEAGQLRVDYGSGLAAAAEAAAVRRLVNLMDAMGRLGCEASNGAVPRVSDVVVEDFILRQGTQSRSLLSPVRLTAALVQLMHEDKRAYRYELQSPSDAKSTVTDQRLKSWGLWIAGQDHARDANRHMVLWLRQWCHANGIRIQEA